MDSKQKRIACSAVLGAWLLAPGAASAQAMSDSDKIQKLEHQTELLQKQSELLQKQLKEVREELARARQKPEKMEISGQAAAAPRAAPPRDAKSPILKAPPPAEQKVKVTLGGFISADAVWRQHNMVNDVGTQFNAVPFPFSPLYDEHEFHATARQSRISVLVEGNIDPWQKLAGYFETDFLAVSGGTPSASNYNETNSWPPRLRQMYVEYDNKGWGFHFLAGQAWSLLTQTRTGITPRQENLPINIDSAAVNFVGFNWTRQWQIRAVQEVSPGVALGVSVENPATIIAASTAAAPAGTGGAFVSGGIVDGVVVNFLNTGTGGFLQAVNVSTDQIPDIIEKAAFDPGWGHYEIFGLQRFFTDHTLTCIPGPCVAGSTGMTGNTNTHTRFGAGIGGSVLIPLIPQYLEFTGNIMYGRGISRYASGQHADATIAADGSITPLPALTAMVGLVAHPYDGLDIFAYAGTEQVYASYFNVGTTLFGFGNPGFSNAGCLIVTPASFAGATPANCIANNRRITELAVGFWQNVYKGNLGRVAVGAQYEYIKREVFAGIGGAPSTDNNIILTSIRYYLPTAAF
jgi:outer membrane murein-binding lipoprotein Lpp